MSNYFNTYNKNLLNQWGNKKNTAKKNTGNGKLETYKRTEVPRIGNLKSD